MKYSTKLRLFTLLFVFFSIELAAQENTNTNKFRQLKQEFATPNVYRTASGAPGHEYWQQKADYVMNIRLDDKIQRIDGEETVTYHNQSPDALSYLWMQLDQNMRAPDSDTKTTRSSQLGQRITANIVEQSENIPERGFTIEQVTDAKGNALPYTINKTMMRIDLPQDLQPGKSVTFTVKWWYNINNRIKEGGRSGYEYFEDDDNYLYTIAQFYPRMAVYNDVEGWQHKQFLGTGEFTLPFGDFEVHLTVPDDHIVGATGELQNPNTVLNSIQLQRIQAAITASEPVVIVTEDEARSKEGVKSEREKTWVFKAKNVRDFAFASSRKFIWDAMGVKFGNRTVLAMSFYPKEGNPLWGQYSTRVVAHTIKTYSKFTFDYPYPVAISVHSDNIGMEYPMICFNGGRPESDGTYSERTKYSMISVIVHEVGHNFFPMIVNSDERQWTWMDEGLNTFVEYLTEEEWEYGFPSRAGEPAKIVPYMKGDKNFMSPIMTNSESVWNLGSNAYYKPTVALNILRETVMGRELFDFAFKQYAQRWMFKHPSPEDFFRTMEDASAIDLDWFWRGWFYTTDNVDIALENVKWMQASTENPEIEKPLARQQTEEQVSISSIRNKETMDQTVTATDSATHDFYTNYDEYAVTTEEMEAYEKAREKNTEKENEILDGNYNFYQLDFKNIGGLVMPIILEFTFEDGSKKVERIPAEIWRRNNEEVSKVFIFKKELTNIRLDPFLETADVNLDNNNWPQKSLPTRFQLYKSNAGRGNYSGTNPMRESLEE